MEDQSTTDWYNECAVICENTANPKNYIDINRYNELKLLGEQAIEKDNIPELRRILGELQNIRISNSDDDNSMYEVANIIRG